jgi:predicted MPP superfamily phosphohydrolase
VLAILAGGLIGAWLGILVAGTVNAPVGPVETRMTLAPSLTGQTDVDIAPLGSLTLNSHNAPVDLRVDVTRLNETAARAIIRDPSRLDRLGEDVTHDVRDGLIRLILRSLLVATLGGLVVGLALWRRNWRRTLLTGGVAFGVVAASAGLGAATWNPRSVAEPRFSGLLASAPSVIGSAQNIVQNFGNYEQELAKLVTNVSRLYDTASALPAAPDPSTIRVLHVSDIHLNPAAFEIIRSLLKQYDISFIVDSGDLTDHGSAPENRLVREIGPLGVPYVFVRGNHDSLVTQDAVAALPNGVVLEGKTVTVGGMRLIGAGDPRFTPDRAVTANEESVIQMGERLASAIPFGERPPDIAVVHDPSAAAPLDGRVPLILAGHTHRRSTRIMQSGTRLFIQGSTGGAGLRALETEKPTPIECSVLYFDRATKRLVAWDDVTISGFGEKNPTSTITRTQAQPEEAGVKPSPGESSPASVSPGSTSPSAVTPSPTPATSSR